MDSMFSMSQATELDMSNFDTSNVTTMGSMFNGSQAKELDVNHFDTSSVVAMSGMFGKSLLSELDVSNFDTSSVTTMKGMFRDSQMPELDISNFDTSSVTNMGSMFQGAQATELDLSNFDTSSVTSMQSMFEDNQATKLNLSSFDTSKVVYIDKMFMNSQATELDLSSFDTTNVGGFYGMDDMFNGSQATTLDLSSFDTSNVSRMRRMFMNSQAKELDLRNFDTSKPYNAVEDMFHGSQATRLYLNSFDTSGIYSMVNMFRSTQAPRLDLSSFDMSSVKRLTNMFSLTKATIGCGKTENDVAILNGTNKPRELMFFVCRDPIILATPDGNTSWSKEHTFSLDIEGYDPRKPVQIAWSPSKNNQDLDWVDVEEGRNVYKIPEVSLENIVSSDLNDNLNGHLYLHVKMTDLTESPFYYVTNNTFAFDNEAPEITVNGDLDDWFRDYELELDLEVITSDNHSGVKQVTLPDGTVVTGQELETLTYTVTDNGSYEFIVEDNVGHKTTYTKEVTMLEKGFSVKVTDTDNKPLEGTEFELYRDGELIETAESDSNGLVDFGTVYTSGDYEVIQTRILEGFRLNNNILEVDVADDDIIIINYYQSEELPSTGTMETLMLLVMGLTSLAVITVTHKKRRKLSKVS